MVLPLSMSWVQETLRHGCELGATERAVHVRVPVSRAKKVVLRPAAKHAPNGARHRAFHEPQLIAVTAV